ncbi:Uncharacterized protein Fot_30387 [Forsythia ovata]|uniref:Uncharacterized protein n=1 Tax=Forsythia ovata TaxID=205694 RepID=A0ABD1TUK3_9LAMI
MAESQLLEKSLSLVDSLSPVYPTAVRFFAVVGDQSLFAAYSRWWTSVLAKLLIARLSRTTTDDVVLLQFLVMERLDYLFSVPLALPDMTYGFSYLEKKIFPIDGAN